MPGTIRHPKRLLQLAGGVIATGLLAAGCTAAGAAPPANPSCGSGSPKLTVQGTGLATGTPDTLTVNIAIATTDATAQAALADDNTKAAAVIAAFTAGGVTKQNIQTTGLSVEPDYTFSHGSEVLTGYNVTNTVTAMLTDISSAGNVIDAVSGAAGDAGQISSVSFSIRDIRTLEDHARTDAVQQAVSHAAAMATSAGERLGPVCSLTDATPVSTVNPGFNTSSGLAQGASAAPPVPLEIGSQQASAQVTIVYSLRAGSTSS